MHNKNILLFITFFFCAFHTIKAQKQSCNLILSGHVKVADSSAISFNLVTVTIAQLKKGVLADSTGNYLLQNICPGRYTLEVKYIGFKTIDTTVRINKNTALDFLLVPENKQLANVTVTGQLIEANKVTTAVKTTLSGQALDETRGLSLGESLKSITGLNSIQTGPSISKPVIHGLYSNRILIVNNGIRQEGQTWGNDHAPEIDPFIATKITVIKGPASIMYGSDAIGGVILLEPKDLRKMQGIDGELNLVGMTNGRVGAASGMVEGTAGKKLEGLSWRLQGTLKDAGNAQAANYYLGNTGFKEDDYSATLQYAKPGYGGEVYYSRFDTKIGIASASHIGTLQDLYDAFKRSEPAVKSDFSYSFGRPYQMVNHTLLKANWFVDLKNGMGKLTATYAYQRDIRKEYDADVSFNDSIARLNPPDLYFNLVTNTADLTWQHPAINKKIVGSIGLNFITHGNSQQGTGYSELIPNFIDYGGGAFIVEKYEVSKWIFEGGFRYDYRWLRAFTLDPTTLVEKKPTYNWHNSTVNAGASYRMNDHFSGVVNFGTAWRPPQVIELFANGIHQSAASFEHGDTSLTLEKAYNTSASVKYNTNNFEAEIGVYVNYFNHYIYLKPDSVPVETIQGTFPTYTYTQVNALFKGIDFNFTYSFLKHFSLISKTSIVRARNLTINDWLINIPADRFDNTLKYQLKGWGKIKDFYIGINNLAVPKQTRVPPKSDYVSPPPGYVLWAADAGCSIPWANNYFDVSVSVTNLTNVAYRDYLNRFRYFIDDLGRNISLRIKVPLDFSKHHS